MAKINYINNKSQDITIDPGASGDSFLQFSINSTGEFRVGVDDDDSDNFKISQGSALGANDTFVMTAAGERTMPLQPCFLGYLASTASNVTGDNTDVQLGSGTPALTEVYDQGNDFNTNGNFTAPIAGKYLLSFGVHVSGITDAAITEYLIRIQTTASTYQVVMIEPNSAKTASNELILTGSAQCDMDASDLAIVVVTGENGTKVIDIEGVARNTFFAGFLMC